MLLDRYPHLVDVGAWTSGIAVALIGAAGTVVQSRRRAGARDQIRSDIEIYESLPEASTVRADLLGRIDEQIRALISSERELTRDRSGVVLSCILIAAGGWTTYIATVAGGSWRWFLVGTLLLGVIGLFGFAESVQKVRRDDKGNKVKN